MASTPTNAQFLASIYGIGFGSAPAASITAALAEAAARTNSNVFPNGELEASAIYCRAAILLLRSPHATNMRDENPYRLSEWEADLSRMQRTATLGKRLFFVP